MTKPSQFQIERAAGITSALAAYANAHDTPAVQTMVGALRIQVSFYEPQGFALLQCAVRDVQAEMEAQAAGATP